MSALLAAARFLAMILACLRHWLIGLIPKLVIAVRDITVARTVMGGKHRPDLMCWWGPWYKAIKVSERAASVLCRSAPPYYVSSRLTSLGLAPLMHKCTESYRPTHCIYWRVRRSDWPAAAILPRNDSTVTLTGARWRRPQLLQSLQNDLHPRPIPLPQHPLQSPRPFQ